MTIRPLGKRALQLAEYWGKRSTLRMWYPGPNTGSIWGTVIACSYDHHFVIVGRENDDIHNVDNRGHDAFVIDVWQSNLNHKSPVVSIRR